MRKDYYWILFAGNYTITMKRRDAIVLTRIGDSYTKYPRPTFRDLINECVCRAIYFLLIYSCISISWTVDLIYEMSINKQTASNRHLQALFDEQICRNEFTMLLKGITTVSRLETSVKRIYTEMRLSSSTVLPCNYVALYRKKLRMTPYLLCIRVCT